MKKILYSSTFLTLTRQLVTVALGSQNGEWFADRLKRRNAACRSVNLEGKGTDPTDVLGRAEGREVRLSRFCGGVTSRRSALLTIGLGLVLLASILAHPARPQPPASAAVSPEAGAWKGVSSCSAFACHGGNRTDGDLRSAYNTWISLDPHSRAGSVLRHEASRTIEARLAAAVGKEPARPEADPRCLGCHIRPGEGATRTLAPIVQEEGVGCEACHGASGRWLEPHSSTSWTRLSERDKTALGMTATWDLSQRAAICARCHVGGGGDDVDHDLIAAGHPRLSFEFLSYLEAMPAHWDTAAERRKAAGFEARAWSIGQFVSARQALELLSDRARGSRRASAGGKNRPLHAGVWPEFAEYACASCHHDIGEVLSATASKSLPTTPGTPQWGIWYFSMLGPLSLGGSEIEGDPLAKLRRLMNDPTPGQEEVENEAKAARARFDRRIQNDSSMTRFDAERIKRLMVRCLDESSSTNRPTWDQKAQLVLALDPLGRALRGLGRPPSSEMNGALDEMRRLVETEQSPAPGAPSRSRDDERFRDAFHRYRRALSRLDSDPP